VVVDDVVAVEAATVVAAGPDGAAAMVGLAAAVVGLAAAAADFLAGLDERGAWGALSDLGPPRT
jgi:hypothetical protein